MRTCKTFLFSSIGMLALVSGCSTSVASETTSSDSEALSTTTDRLVSIRLDLRRCAAPLCGGYFVHELNHRGESYVSSIDLSASTLDASTIADVLSTSDAIVLKGHLGPADEEFGTRTFLATDVWRGMPGVIADRAGAFFTVSPRTPPIACFTGPCPNEIASAVNGQNRFAFDSVDITPAALPFVDTAWLASRVTNRGAVVAASWVDGEQFEGGAAKVLQASQVYVHLPDRVGPCPAFPDTKCEDGTIAAFQRTADRCVIQTGCVPAAICTMFLPACAAGYTLSRWTGDTGCPRFACDPTFVTP